MDVIASMLSDGGEILGDITGLRHRRPCWLGPSAVCAGLGATAELRTRRRSSEGGLLLDRLGTTSYLGRRGRTLGRIVDGVIKKGSAHPMMVTNAASDGEAAYGFLFVHSRRGKMAADSTELGHRRIVLCITAGDARIVGRSPVVGTPSARRRAYAGSPTCLPGFQARQSP